MIEIMEEITIKQGSRYTFPLLWEDTSGSPKDLRDYFARMQFRTHKGDASALLSLTSGITGGITLGGVDGTIDIEITAVQSAALEEGYGFCDLELVPCALIGGSDSSYTNCVVDISGKTFTSNAGTPFTSVPSGRPDFYVGANIRVYDAEDSGNDGSYVIAAGGVAADELTVTTDPGDDNAGDETIIITLEDRAVRIYAANFFVDGESTHD